ncbi:CidA/LrgA family protein [Rhodobacteraceae bacterium SC52]|nr:CidA/LrgA family protein [Rhodobacteraceae bacterium SC52]
MLHAIAILLTCQLVGQVTVTALSLSLPGPVLGMALLVGLMLAVPKLYELVRELSEGLLAHLSLLFVPAGVGVVAHLPLLGQNGPALLVALVVSTVGGLTVSVLVFSAVLRLVERGA